MKYTKKVGAITKKTPTRANANATVSVYLCRSNPSLLLSLGKPIPKITIPNTVSIMAKVNCDRATGVPACSVQNFVDV